MNSLCRVISTQANPIDHRPWVHQKLNCRKDLFDARYQLYLNYSKRVQQELIRVLSLCSEHWLSSINAAANLLIKKKEAISQLIIQSGLSQSDSQIIIEILMVLISEKSMNYLVLETNPNSSSSGMEFIMELVHACERRIVSKACSNLSYGDNLRQGINSLVDKHDAIGSLQSLIDLYLKLNPSSVMDPSVIIILIQDAALTDSRILNDAISCLKEQTGRYYLLVTVNRMYKPILKYLYPSAPSTLPQHLLVTKSSFELLDELLYGVIQMKDIPLQYSSELSQWIHQSFETNDYSLSDIIQRIIHCMQFHFKSPASVLCMFQDFDWLAEMKLSNAKNAKFNLLNEDAMSIVDPDEEMNRKYEKCLEMSLFKLLEALNANDLDGTGLTALPKNRSKNVVDDKDHEKQDVTGKEPSMDQISDLTSPLDLKIQAVQSSKQRLVTRCKQLRYDQDWHKFIMICRNRFIPTKQRLGKFSTDKLWKAILNQKTNTDFEVSGNYIHSMSPYSLVNQLIRSLFEYLNIKDVRTLLIDMRFALEDLQRCSLVTDSSVDDADEINQDIQQILIVIAELERQSQGNQMDISSSPRILRQQIIKLYQIRFNHSNHFQEIQPNDAETTELIGKIFIETEHLNNGLQSELFDQLKNHLHFLDLLNFCCEDFIEIIHRVNELFSLQNVQPRLNIYGVMDIKKEIVMETIQSTDVCMRKEWLNAVMNPMDHLHHWKKGSISIEKVTKRIESNKKKRVLHQKRVPDVSLLMGKLIDRPMYASSTMIARELFDDFVSSVQQSNTVSSTKRKKPVEWMDQKDKSVHQKEIKSDAASDKHLVFRFAQAVHEIERSGFIQCPSQLNETEVHGGGIQLKRGLFCWLDKNNRTSN